MILTCEDVKIYIKDISTERIHWLNAVKKYFRILAQNVLSLGKDDSELKIALYDILDELDTITKPSNYFLKNIFSGINFVSEIILQSRIVDEITETINIEVVERLKEAFAFFGLYGFYIWMTAFEKDDFPSFSSEDAKDLLETLNKIAPYFEERELFLEKNKKSPPSFCNHIEEKIKIFKKSIEKNKHIRIIKNKSEIEL